MSDEAVCRPAPSNPAHPRGTTSSGFAEVHVILLVIGRELAELARLACVIQTDVSPLANSTHESDRAFKSLQGLDLLTQVLGGLAAFLEVLAPSLPTEWRGDASKAARAVTLSHLAQRLATPTVGLPPDTPEDTGAFELFESEVA